MTGEPETEIIINKANEIRSQEIANMINEGGLGAEEYYVILKHRQAENKVIDKANENHIQ
jgi:hypothetical protein